MKTRYKFIHFEDESVEAGVCWRCYYTKGGHPIGEVVYRKPCSKYIYRSEIGMGVFDVDCLLDIADFLGQLKDDKAK